MVCVFLPYLQWEIIISKGLCWRHKVDYQTCVLCLGVIAIKLLVAMGLQFPEVTPIIGELAAGKQLMREL